MSLPTLKLGRNSLGYPAFVTDDRELVTDEVLIQTAVDLRRAETFREQREAIANFAIAVGAVTETLIPSKNLRQGILSMGSSVVKLTVAPSNDELYPNVEHVKAVIGGSVPRRVASLDYRGNGTGFVVVKYPLGSPSHKVVIDGEEPILGGDTTESRLATALVRDTSDALYDMGHTFASGAVLFESVVLELARTS
ncbi:MAG: hypothetical protein Q7T41_03320 [Candidatus Saccharibacteria bacterium]|nr:hypothetical protein [Candidatus Saccharibacteria bacterium]